MARSHIAVALGAALVALVVVGQLALNLGLPNNGSWHWNFGQLHPGVAGGKHDAGLADASQYLVGVGKADITG